MAPRDDTTLATRFDSLHVYRTSYKKIVEHEIEVGILVPKDLKPEKHPLMVKFHGGGLVSSAYTMTVGVHTFNVIISSYTNINTSTHLYPQNAHL
jgi:cephalosporin-C deacetylase-like acetyl esterase